ncbi:G1 family glutamic endopeptidase [Streptomyces gamaensis]|uniref:G1 family glutamic endopeptidase n=1 Tax=Streptomyces gamaensis TaxID=1763542 RepID=A0ABW0ZAH5_9ACTN
MHLRMNARRLGAVAAAVLSGAALTLSPEPAATGAAPAPTAFGPGPGPGGKPGDIFQGSNWGGYAAEGHYTSISGSWVQPHVTCAPVGSLFGIWLGLDGYGSSTVEQTGVQIDCSSGTPELSGWYEMYPANPVYWRDPIAEGDSMTASVVFQGNSFPFSGGRYTITLKDNTRGWTETVSPPVGNAHNASAEAVIESPVHSYPYFQQVDFTNITVNGKPFGGLSPSPVPLTSDGYAPGPLNGGSFAITPAGRARARHLEGAAARGR